MGCCITIPKKQKQHHTYHKTPNKILPTETISQPPKSHYPSTSTTEAGNIDEKDALSTLLSMGFNEQISSVALANCNYNIYSALEYMHQYMMTENQLNNYNQPPYDIDHDQVMDLGMNEISTSTTASISTHTSETTQQNNTNNVPWTNNITEQEFKGRDIIIMPIKDKCNVFNPFSIKISSSMNCMTVLLDDLLNKAINIIDKQLYPKKYYIHRIEKESFIKKEIQYDNDEWVNICSQSLMCYDRNDIINDGLIINVRIKYTHKVSNNQITCKYLKNDIDDTLQCPIYKSMRVNYQYTQNNLNHLYEFVHFKDEYASKPKCRHNRDCNAFNRLEEGGNRLNDRCHVKLYCHAPRSDHQIKLSQNMSKFVVNTEYKENHPLYWPNDDQRDRFNDTDGYLQYLIDEVISNNFKYDLCLQCNKYDDCKHNDYSILNIVDDKINHIRHEAMGKPLRRDHMLSLILYTGCDCNYDLCSSQRDKDYVKWKWFDFCLYDAISKLSSYESGSYKLYSGLQGVKLNKTKVVNGYFPTYVSCSWNRNVSTIFMGHKGMLIQIDKTVRKTFRCCDVSWISKFPDECEILIARNTQKWDNFVLAILDEENGTQTVSMTLQR